MTLFPAIVVFAVLFLSFSKKTLSQQEKTHDLDRSKGRASEAMLDSNALLKYELLQRGLEKRS